MYTNNHDVFVQFGKNKTCKVFKNQLNCMSPEVLNLSMFNFFSNVTKKKKSWLLIDNIQEEN